MKEIIAEYKDLSISFHRDNKTLKAVSNVSFNIYKTEVLAIVGESGSGKTLTAMGLLGLLKNSKSVEVSGSINLNNKNLLHSTEEELRKIRGKHIGAIYQDPMTSLNPVLTIGTQLTEGYIIHNKENKTSAKERAYELLNKVGISDCGRIYKSYPHQLSGGMRQRVMIAMALMCSPMILLADEPTTALDVTIQAQILNLLKEIKDSSNMSILLISHDLGVVSKIADRILVMYGGEVVEIGSTESIIHSPIHPYTKGLIKSNLLLSDNGKRLYSIKGTPISGYELPSYCSFYDRCEYRIDKCKSIKPSILEVTQNHYSSCIRAKEMLNCE